MIPSRLGLLKGAWSGESHEQEQLRQIKQMLDMLPQLPPELQAKLKAMPPELRAAIDALPPEAPARPDPAPLLRHLVAVGLATEERTGPDDANPDLTCHELVRERIFAWMHDHPTGPGRPDGKRHPPRLCRAAGGGVQGPPAPEHDRRPRRPAAAPWSIAFRPGPTTGWVASPARSSPAPAIPACWRACSRTWRPPPSRPRRAGRAGPASATSPMR